MCLEPSINLTSGLSWTKHLTNGGQWSEGHAVPKIHAFDRICMFFPNRRREYWGPLTALCRSSTFSWVTDSTKDASDPWVYSSGGGNDKSLFKCYALSAGQTVPKSEWRFKTLNPENEGITLIRNVTMAQHPKPLQVNVWQFILSLQQLLLFQCNK